MFVGKRKGIGQNKAAFGVGRQDALQFGERTAGHQHALDIVRVDGRDEVAAGDAKEDANG